MSMNLEPREVLAYLNQLGYNNITKEQLKEFIHDLKKLVKYDDAKRNDCEAHLQNNCRPTPISARPRVRPRPTEIEDMDLGVYSDTSGDLLVPCNTSDSAVSQSSAIDKENVTSQHKQHKQNNQASTRPSINCRPSTDSSNTSESRSSSSFGPSTSSSHTKLTEGSGTSKNTKATAKTTTSFIRPWRLISAPVKSLPNQRRTDPVSLYHHYQSIWNRQKLPGEDSHAELRWSIREKMLGQDPHPRPISSASSVEHMKRHHRSNK